MRRSAHFDCHAHSPDVSLVEALTVPAVQAGQGHASGKDPVEQGTVLEYKAGAGQAGASKGRAKWDCCRALQT